MLPEEDECVSGSFNVVMGLLFVSIRARESFEAVIPFWRGSFWLWERERPLGSGHH
jgi:hypothetical protein